MGQLTIAARLSDLEIVCFKVEKMKEFSEIHNIPFSLHSIACSPSEWDFIQNTGEKNLLKNFSLHLRKILSLHVKNRNIGSNFLRKNNMFNKKKSGIDWPKNQLLFPVSNRYIVMDVETMNPYSDVIQLAAVEIVNGKIERELFKNIKPLCRSYNPFCQKVHGITLNDVRFEKTFKQFSPELVRFIGNSPILAHNRPAEYKSLLFEYNQAKILFPFYIGNFYCTMKMAKNIGLTGKLREMAQQVGIRTNHLRQEHDALSDTKVAAELFIQMQKIRRK